MKSITSYLVSVFAPAIVRITIFVGFVDRDACRRNLNIEAGRCVMEDAVTQGRRSRGAADNFCQSRTAVEGTASDSCKACRQIDLPKIRATRKNIIINYSSRLWKGNGDGVICDIKHWDIKYCNLAAIVKINRGIPAKPFYKPKKLHKICPVKFYGQRHWIVSVRSLPCRKIAVRKEFFSFCQIVKPRKRGLGLFGIGFGLNDFFASEKAQSYHKHKNKFFHKTPFYNIITPAGKAVNLKKAVNLCF